MKSKFLKKILVMLTILGIQGFFLYTFYDNEDLIFNFKTSYFTKVYLPSYFLSLNNFGLTAKNYLANLTSVFGFNNMHVPNGLSINSQHSKSIPVLLYHGIIDEPDGANVLLENFKEQMFALKKAGWQTVSIDDFYAFMRGEKQVPDKSLLLTFDDGRKDSYYPVNPILKALNYKAVMFVITGRSTVDEKEVSPFHLSLSELKRMKKSNQWDLQSHGRDDHDFYKIDADGNEGHFLSNKLWLEAKQRIETEEEFKIRIYNDFINSKNDLENAFGIDVVGFAYPFGDFGQNSINFPEAKNAVLDTVKSVYPMSFYQVWGGNPKTNYPQPDSEHLFTKRINVEPQWSADNLLAVLEKSRAKIFPYQDDFSKDNGWQRDWGNMDFRGDAMMMSAHASTTGSAVFLDGAYLWRNYISEADVYLTKGQVFSLTARYKDGKNYAACSFLDKSIRVEQVLSGEKKILSELKGDFVFIGKNREVGIGVYDNTVNCYLDGRIAITGFNLDQGLDSGGIGFKTWDPKVNNSEIIVQKVNVREISDGEANEFILAIKRELAKDKLSVLKKSLESARQILEDTSNKQKEGNRVDSNGKKSSLASANILWSLTDNAENSTPYHKIDFTGDLGWKKMWGEYFVKDRALRISSGNSNSSALVIQNNSVSWSDYFFKTRLDWLKGATFSLVARYQDSKNYMACVYSNYGDGVRLDQVIDGKTITLASNYGLSTPYFMPWADLNFGVKVRDNHIECFVNDQRIFNFNVDQMPKIGGIGFKVWDNTPIGGEVAVREINVEAIKN